VIADSVRAAVLTIATGLVMRALAVVALRER
jgi:hypothetical protein